jgi:hypothetical protein
MKKLELKAQHVAELKDLQNHELIGIEGGHEICFHSYRYGLDSYIKHVQEEREKKCFLVLDF